jgi:hypothetical protein
MGERAVTKSASVDHRKSEYIVTSYTQTDAGFWQMNGHFSRLRSSAVPDDLGQAVLSALDASNRLPLTHTGASESAFAPVLEELGLKTYTQYMKGTLSVSVEIAEGDVLSITPMRNGGAREGFHLRDALAARGCCMRVHREYAVSDDEAFV